ncbi:hypothetical protein C8R46DRAFT_1046806 [Mycena filopes]|nr:hypothetical protein C8R46DRAFT_1046806 [Mycena filopes]
MKVYPEVQEDLNGTLDELERLCVENRNIQRTEEGKLTRFGMRFRALVKKLSKAPAIILNKEACRRYLDALERGFAESLKMAINTRNLIKADLQPAAAPQPAAPNTVDHRKEDPILLDELVKMAERLAATGGTEATWGEGDSSEVKRSERFPMVKIERREAQLEELGGEVSSLRDTLAVVQKQSRAAHEELMKAFQNMKNSPPTREDNDGRDSMQRGGPPPNGYGADRQKKGVAGQHMYSDTFYGGALDDEFDALRDEVRTLRVKLNQVTTGGQRMPPTQQGFMVNTPAESVPSSQAVPASAINMEEFGRTVFNAMRMGNPAQDQYIQTRSGARTMAVANPPEQDF